MKLANPNDKRSFRRYKKSLARFSMMRAPKLDLRQRCRRKSKSKVVLGNLAEVHRQTKNPYKTEIGSNHSAARKLKSAAICTKHGIRRMVQLKNLNKYHSEDPKVLCKLCLHRGIRRYTRWGCLGCGCELCIKVCVDAKNRSPLSCADAAHQQNRINIDDFTVKK